jgi:hypothetical protein
MLSHRRSLAMIRILYISTARTPLSEPAMRDLLATARRKNAVVDVTGLLVVGGRRFLQALEGPADAVASIYDTIASDPRHFAIVKLSEKPIMQRSFASWSMGCQAGGAVSDSATLEQQVAAIVAPIADASLRAYFTDFSKRHASV